MRKYILYLSLLSAIEIALSLFLTHWRETFWNFVEHKDFIGFIHQLGVFTGTALALCAVSGASGYCVTLASLAWSRKLIPSVLDKLPKLSSENLPQKIETDGFRYPFLTVNLVYTCIKSLGYVILFTIFFLQHYSYVYLVSIYSYALITFFITKTVAQPLVAFNYKQQKAQATFRASLTHFNFSECLSIALGLAKKQKHLTYLQSFISQVAVVLPLILISHEYFTTEMTLGALMMFNGMCAIMLDNLLYPLNSFGVINDLLASKKRFYEIEEVH